MLKISRCFRTSHEASIVRQITNEKSLCGIMLTLKGKKKQEVRRSAKITQRIRCSQKPTWKYSFTTSIKYTVVKHPASRKGAF
jgi:hypothetical protein